VQIYYRTGNKTLEELLAFPIYGHDSLKTGREKQRRLLGQTAKEPAQETISRHEDEDFAPEEKISDAPAPKVVPKALTGRIRPEWRNGE